MMGDDYVQFNDVNKQVIEDCRERIEHLFGVRLGISENGKGRCNCQIVCQSGHAPEVLVKTKNYINALTAEGAGFSITTESFNLHQVNMILQHKDEIEKESTTVLLASPYSNNVRLQGQLQDIILAKNIIESLLTQEQAPATGGDRNTTNPYDTKTETLLKGTVNRTELTQHREVKTDVNKMVELGKTAGSESWMTEKYVQEHLNNLGIDTTVAQLRLTSDSEDSESDCEDLFNEIQKDPDYKNKVEFAFKLGYQEWDLLQALRNLGRQASQNELLSELIKQGSSKGEGDGSGSDGSPILSPEHDPDMLEYGLQQRMNNLDPSNNLRHIIIDGSNVAMSHGNKEVFSCMGIKLAVDWFRNRGHTDITVFVPQWRKETSRADARIKDQTILNQLEKDKILVFTPARRIGGKRVVCYDDRYILKLAVETDGIVVSNDNYRDLSGEKEEFKKVIEERLLMYSFVNDRFMPPDDPLGRNGPTLDNFLLIQPLEPEALPPPCPYGSKKCTYGNKCKYYHPERKNQPHKMVTEKLAEQAKQRMQEMKERNTQQTDGKKKLSSKMSLSRTKSLTTSETSKQSLPTNLIDQRTGSTSNLLNTEEKYAEYNQKLSENLRKMEREHAKKESYSQSMHKSVTMSPERGSSELRSRGCEYSERQSSPRWSGMRTSREASPVNLAVPGHAAGLDSGEQFVSGHLLLAKKLSDEANESDKLKKMEKRQESGSNSPSSSQQFQRIGVIGQSPDSKKAKPKQPVVKQKLSRQLSLQGGEDPRLKQGHSALRPQYSLEPIMQHSRPSMIPLNNNEGSLMKDFMNSQSFDGQNNMNVTSVSSGAPQGMFGAIGQSIPSHMQKSHAPLSRMQSAPLSNPSQPTQQLLRPVPTMLRQNSSSDTQLNKLDYSEDTGYIGERVGQHGHIGDHLAHRGSIGEPLGHRGSLPMKDKSSGLTFQIGGSVPARQPLQHCNSMGALNQGYQQYRSSDQDFMYQQPQYLSQTYSDIPQSRMPFMHSNHGNNIHGSFGNNRIQQQHMPAGYNHHRSSPPFMPAQQQIRDQMQLIEQSGIWQSTPYESTSISSANLGNMSMLSQGTTHHSQPASHHHPLIQQQFSVPIPEDRPITADDPRYKLYYHLCGLFPEEKVRLVMNQHPETMNPKEICAYIIRSG